MGGGAGAALACQRAGVAPRFTEWDGVGTPEAFVISKNLHRRHLTTRQRSAIAAEIVNMERGDTKAHAPFGACTISADDAAAMMGVSRRAVVRALKVKRDDPEAHAKWPQNGLKTPRSGLDGCNGYPATRGAPSAPCGFPGTVTTAASTAARAEVRSRRS